MPRTAPRKRRRKQAGSSADPALIARSPYLPEPRARGDCAGKHTLIRRGQEAGEHGRVGPSKSRCVRLREANGEGDPTMLVDPRVREASRAVRARRLPQQLRARALRGQGAEESSRVP